MNKPIVLPEFQGFLLKRGFANPKNVSFFAHWVSKFLALSRARGDLSHDQLIEMYLSHLKEDSRALDWQRKQAEDALRLYFHYFLGGDVAKLITEPANTLTPALSSEGTSGSPIRSEGQFNPKETLPRMRDILRLKHYSFRTEKSYLDWAERFFSYWEKTKKVTSGNPPQNQDARDYLSHLALERRVSASTQNQAFNALLFLFREALETDLGDMSQTVRARRGLRLPVVLSQQEMTRLLKSARGLGLPLSQLLYGAGLRLMELAHLRVKDIDFDQSTIMVRAAKGDKDRTTVLPKTAEEALRKMLEETKKIHDQDLARGFGEVFLPDGLDQKYPDMGKEWAWQYVFPAERLSVDPQSGKVRRHHISEKTIQNLVSQAAKVAGIHKHVTPHTLRHTFATHLLMKGVNIREIQSLLGHKHLETTMTYTHVLKNLSAAPKSPLDELLESSNAVSTLR